MTLRKVIEAVADALWEIDRAGKQFKAFQPGVGPFGEPQLVRLIAANLNGINQYKTAVKTARTPDLLIRGSWAIEVKIARPFGDNGRLAENWSVNLLHPYPGKTSLLGECRRRESA